jgi:hypothetical protein
MASRGFLQSGQVKASNGLAANGGILGAFVNAKLMKMNEDIIEARDTRRTVHGIVRDQIQQGTAAANRVADREHQNKTNLQMMKDMTEGVNKGEISPLVQKAGEFQGQVQALRPELNDIRSRLGNSSGVEMPKGETPEAETPAAETPKVTPAGAKGSRGTGKGQGRSKTIFADSTEKHVNPVSAAVAQPFSYGGSVANDEDAADANKRASITPDESAPVVTPTKVSKPRTPKVPKVANS